MYTDTKSVGELLKAMGGSSNRGIGKAFRQVYRELTDMEEILHILAAEGGPMRVKEICERSPSFQTRWYDGEINLDINKCLARLRLMRRAGLVVRKKVEGNPIEFDNYTIIPSHFMYCLPD